MFSSSVWFLEELDLTSLTSDFLPGSRKLWKTNNHLRVQAVVATQLYSGVDIFGPYVMYLISLRKLKWIK